MSKPRRIRAQWLTRQLAFAHNVLRDPTATDAQRRAARCRINRVVDIQRRLSPIGLMKRGLDVDKRKRWEEAA
jgi:hypothetical protein